MLLASSPMDLFSARPWKQWWHTEHGLESQGSHLRLSAILKGLRRKRQWLPILLSGSCHLWWILPMSPCLSDCLQLHPGDTRKLKYPEIVGEIHTNAIIKWLLNFICTAWTLDFPDHHTEKGPLWVLISHTKKHPRAPTPIHIRPLNPTLPNPIP